jgi:hypothetical protein
MMLLDPDMMVPTLTMDRVLNKEDKRRQEGDINRRDAGEEGWPWWLDHIGQPTII